MHTNIYLHFFEKKPAEARFVGGRADFDSEHKGRGEVGFVDLAVCTTEISCTTS